MVLYSPGWTESYDWLIYFAFVLSFTLAFGGGANDTANSFGTSVGSGVLKLWQAYLLAAICDTLGGTLLGYTVTESIQKMIVDIDVYTVYSTNSTGTWNVTDVACSTNNNSLDTDMATDACMTYTSKDFMLGEIGAMIGATLWQIFATLCSMPISTTQSIVGGTVGFSLALKGNDGIRWDMIYKIAISWVVSPVLSGLVSSWFYFLIKVSILTRPNPYEASLTMLPFLYGIIAKVIIFAILYDGSKYLHLHFVTLWQAVLASIIIGTFIAFLVQIFVVKRIRKQIDGDESTSAKDTNDSNSEQLAKQTKDYASLNQVPLKQQNLNSNSEQDKTDEHYLVQEKPNYGSLLSRTFFEKVGEDSKTIRVFHYLQTVSACYVSFSHGTNDTANAVGPLVGIWVTWVYGYAGADVSSDYRIVLLLLFGTLSGVVGIVCLGHKVIQTIGKEVTTISAPSVTRACQSVALRSTPFTVIGSDLSPAHMNTGNPVLH